jgi:hypothetical protein
MVVSEMVERVARAIWAKSEDGLFGVSFDERRGMFPNGDSAFDLARAAIEAMREPTQSMYDHETYTSGQWSNRTLEAMIDAALAPAADGTPNA